MKIEFITEPSIYTPGPLDDRYEIPPRAPDGLARAKKACAGQKLSPEVVEALRSYNRSIGSATPLDPNIPFVITGQQLGFMGGPLYTILKGISAILYAKKMGGQALMWLHTEDHDTPEISHTYLLDTLGNLDRYKITFPRGRAVESLTISPLARDEIERFCRATGTKTRGLASFSEEMASFMAALFEGQPLIFVEPKVLRPFATPIFKQALEENREIELALANAHHFKPHGGTEVFEILPGGKRHRVMQTMGKGVYSASGALRPVVQSSLLPTLAYVAGPSELLYFSDLKELYHQFGLSMPWIVPRLSATLFPENYQNLPPHFQENLFHPKGKLQERVLNFCYFKTAVSELIAQLSVDKDGHFNCYLGEQ